MSKMSAAEAEVVARFDAAEPAPESWRRDDGLRAAIAQHHADYNGKEPVLARDWWFADAVLALPEVAALRAKADAADRVRDEIDALSRETGAFEASYKGWALKVVSAIRRALDGPAS